MTPTDPDADALPDEVRSAVAHALGPTRLALMLAVVGAIIAALRVTYLPTIPRLVPGLLIALALGVMLVGTVRRLRYGWRHLRKP